MRVLWFFAGIVYLMRGGPGKFSLAIRAGGGGASKNARKNI